MDRMAEPHVSIDEKEFSALYETYMPKIYGYVTRRINNKEIAEDIVSKVFERVVEHFSRFNPKKSSFKTWIYTITTRCMIDYFRTNAHRLNADLSLAENVSDEKPTPRDEAVSSADREVVHTVISNLPDNYQKILLLKYFSDLTIDEISQVLEVSSNAVSVMIHRALKAFQITYNRYV